MPEPGGWSRFQLELDDLDATVARLEAARLQVPHRSDPGQRRPSGLVEDPSGNVIELFEAT